MPDYRVAFYKTVLSSDGHPSKCLQECIDIHDLQDPTGAARAATQAFQERHAAFNHEAEQPECAADVKRARNVAQDRRVEHGRVPFSPPGLNVP